MFKQQFLCEQSKLSTRVVIDRTFDELKKFLEEDPSPILFCVDTHISRQFVEEIRCCFPHDHPCWIWEAEGGEMVKTREAKSSLEDWALQQGVGSDCTVIALGGGAFLDLVGFFAATYMRGVPFISIPSTILAMADSAFGGKNGVNACGIKNIIGTIWHPKLVMNHLGLLKTLPLEQRAYGLVEAIKHAFLSSSEDTETVFSLWERCVNGDEEALEIVLALSISIKAKIMMQAFENPEKRHLLNLGHTVAHGIEGLERISHGLAVVIGIWVETRLAVERTIADQEVVSAAQRLLQLFPDHRVLSSQWSKEDWCHVLARDKKNVDGVPCVVFLEGIGKPFVHDDHIRMLLTSEEIDRSYQLVQEFCRS